MRNPLIRVMRTLSVLLATSLLCRADDRGTLAIRVVEGSDAIYAVGSRATRGITVLVSDEAGLPVDGATVSFALPAEGSGGVFTSGSRMEIVSTRDGGQASVWGMRWNRTPGHFEVRVTAVKGSARAAATVAQSLSEATELKTVSPRGSGSHKILWIVLAGGAAAAAAGVAGRGSAGSGASVPAAASVTGVQIGTPTITVGRP